MIRVAAVGDVHFGADTAGRLRPHLMAASGAVDLVLLAGDLTRRGEPAEARVLAAELEDLPVPVVAVLGNHDYHHGAEREIAAILEAAGVRVLEGGGEVLPVGGTLVGVAGVKGFAGGFAGACVSEFGEPEMKTFAARSRRDAEALGQALTALVCDVRIALLHYSPVEGTLVGEPPGLWPFLGSYLLAAAVDAGGAVLALHGHAHSGSGEVAWTPGGVPVMNVAQPVIRRPFVVVDVEGTEEGEGRRWDSITTASRPSS